MVLPTDDKGTADSEMPRSESHPAFPRAYDLNCLVPFEVMETGAGFKKSIVNAMFLCLIC